MKMIAMLLCSAMIFFGTAAYSHAATITGISVSNLTNGEWGDGNFDDPDCSTGCKGTSFEDSSTGLVPNGRSEWKSDVTGSFDANNNTFDSHYTHLLATEAQWSINTALYFNGHFLVDISIESEANWQLSLDIIRKGLIDFNNNGGGYLNISGLTVDVTGGSISSGSLELAGIENFNPSSSGSTPFYQDNSAIVSGSGNATISLQVLFELDSYSDGGVAKNGDEICYGGGHSDKQVGNIGCECRAEADDGVLISGTLTNTTPEPQAPVANAGSDQTVCGQVALNGSGSTDDVTIVSYDWQIEHRDNSAYNRSTTGIQPTVANLEAGVYDVTLTVTDDIALTDSDTMILMVDPDSCPNIPPVADAGPDQSVCNQAMLNGRASEDQDGDIFSYDWQIVHNSNPAFNQSATGEQPTVTNLEIGTYTVTLTVTDDDTETGSDIMAITVEEEACANSPPIANAGSDRIVCDEVTLDGNSSDDPDGNIISYEWQIVHRDNSAYNTSATNAQPTVTGLLQGIYDVTLTVTDNGGAIGNDSIIVTANGPDCSDVPPIADAGPDQSVEGRAVILDGSNSKDPNGNIVSYAWMLQYSNILKRREQSKDITVTGPKPMVTDLAQGYYEVTLNVTDDEGLSDTDTMSLTSCFISIAKNSTMPTLNTLMLVMGLALIGLLGLLRRPSDE